MKQAPQEPAALEKRAQPGRLRAIVLAVAVHVAFFALIIFGVTWQSMPTAPVQAELWDKLPPAKTAEPKPAPPKPEPAPPKPEPEPPKPEPPKPEPPKPEPPKPEVKPPPAPDPAIAQKLEREKLEREKREHEKRERLEREKRERAEKQKQEEVRKRREQEEVAKKRREDEKRRRDEELARQEAERARQAAISARQAEVNRYIERIKAKILSRANVPDTVPTGTEVHIRVRILPGGEVLESTITRRSGNPAYDSAIERAIRSASPLPVPPVDSELFPQFRDLILQFDHKR